MSDTPISDSTPHNVAELGMLCRRLERELTESKERIKRLEEAGDALAKTQTYDLVETVNWRKARGEAKP